MDALQDIAPLLAGRRVVVVDDDGELCDAFEDVLRDAGHEVVCFSNGERALKYLRIARRPDVVLLAEIGFVASMVTWVGFLTRGASLTVAAVLALVLITLYHSGREVTRQGLPHFGRIVRDMAIPVAIMATVAEFVPNVARTAAVAASIVVCSWRPAAGTASTATRVVARRWSSARRSTSPVAPSTSRGWPTRWRSTSTTPTRT